MPKGLERQGVCWTDLSPRICLPPFPTSPNNVPCSVAEEHLGKEALCGDLQLGTTALDMLLDSVGDGTPRGGPGGVATIVGLIRAA